MFLADGPFLTWQNPKPFPITAMSFKTGVPNADSFAGTWYIRQHMGKHYQYSSTSPDLGRILIPKDFRITTVVCCNYLSV